MKCSAKKASHKKRTKQILELKDTGLNWESQLTASTPYPIKQTEWKGG